MNLGLGAVHSHPHLAAPAAGIRTGGGAADATGGAFAGRVTLLWPSSSTAAAFWTRAAVHGAGPVSAAAEAAAAAQSSFYDLLGIPESGSFEEIKRAYKQMVRKYHPDVSPPDRAEEYTRRFIAVQEAYETLSDPGRRALYDRDLSKGLHVAFSTRRRFDEELEERSSWRNRWQCQLEELKRRSMSKDLEDNLSWGARMRRRRAESSTE